LPSLISQNPITVPASTSWANSLGCGPEACTDVAETTLERTLAAPPAEELVDDDEELEGLAVVVVVAADDVETPFLIADVFRRGAATACATIVPRRAGSGAAALPLVVATVMKQLCELVRAKDAILERDKKKRVKKRASCFLCSLFSRGRKRESGRKRERERERERENSSFSSSTSTTSATSSTTATS